MIIFLILKFFLGMDGTLRLYFKVEVVEMWHFMMTCDNILLGGKKGY